MLVPSLLLALAAELHVDSVRGFQIEVPDGWTKVEQDMGAQGHVVSLQAPGSGGARAVQVRVTDSFGVSDGEAFVRQSRATIEADPETYSEYEEWEDEIGGVKVAGVRANYKAPSGTYRLVQSVVFRDGVAYLLQRHAPVDEFDSVADELEAVADTFALTEISEEGKSERALVDLVKRCGSEVEWAESWADAARRAEEEDKLVVVVLFLVSGFSISDTPRTTVFMDEDVVRLVNERYVPLWYEKGMEGAFVEVYGLGPSTFGQGLIVCTPDGEVVLDTDKASHEDVAYPFLRAALQRRPELAGSPIPADLAGPDLAEKHVDRGEFQAAFALLKDDDSARAHRLRARMYRLTRRGGDALEALELAREAGSEEDAAVAVEEALVLMREERRDEAEGRLGSVLAEHAGTEVGRRAQYVRAILDLSNGDKDEARRRWREVAREAPDSRWAWASAAALTSLVLKIDVPFNSSWPDEAVLRSLLDFPDRAPLGAGEVPRARADALTWLLREQRADGSWPCPAMLQQSAELGADPFVDAITSLCGRALLRHLDDEGAASAVHRAVDFVQASVRSREDVPPIVLFMDYMTWSNAMMLHFLADAVDAGVARRAQVAPTVEALLADLGTRQVDGAGWSYYVTNDLEGSGAPPQSISFTTAAAVIALARVHEAGFDVPSTMLQPAVTALQRMRGDDGVFSYFLFKGADRGQRSTALPGAVGRGPVCEHALFANGRSDEARMRRALELFLEHIDLYTPEQGKSMMHAGPHAQGCHYLLFDYATAAAAESRLPADGKTRAMLTEVTMDCRQPDGSFLDTPLMGRSYGTAMALLVFDALTKESPQ